MELYDHQNDAIQKLHNGAILVAGVGTGKSLTALGYFLQKVYKDNPIIPLYIITTARKRDTHEWEMECIKSGIGVTYDISVTVDSWNNITKYLDVSDAFFIFDEQRAVGRGQWAKAFVKIARRNKWIMLTATPGDTWMDYIPVFLANNFYRNRSEFIKRHVVFSPYTKFPKVEKYLEVDELIRLRDSILVNMFFHKPATVMEETIVVDYDILAYKELLKTRWDFEKECPIENYSQLCSLLRKISNSHESRIKELLLVLNKHSKCIIFYNYNYELDTLRAVLESNGIEYAEWNGQKHEELPEGERWCYLVQYNAGAEGWNCTQADTLIFYSLNYSYKTSEQAKGRINRLNTPFTNLYYYRFRTESSIDKAIERCLSRKQKFNEKLFIDKEC